MKRVLFRAEMASKILDSGEEDDLDLERLADKLIATLRSIQPDKAMEREENKAGASVGSVFGVVRGSRSEVNLPPLHRGRVLRSNGGRRTYHLL